MQIKIRRRATFALTKRVRSKRTRIDTLSSLIAHGIAQPRHFYGNGTAC